MIRGVEDLLIATKLPVYQFENRKEDSYLDFDERGYPYLLYVPQIRTQHDVAINLHELGHFVDWRRLQPNRVQRAFATDLHDLTEMQWWMQVTAEIRAWRNAMRLCKEVKICLHPTVWNYFLLRNRGLPSYYRHWERFHKKPPKKLLRAVEALYLELETLCPGF